MSADFGGGVANGAEDAARTGDVCGAAAKVDGEDDVEEAGLQGDEGGAAGGEVEREREGFTFRFLSAGVSVCGGCGVLGSFFLAFVVVGGVVIGSVLRRVEEFKHLLVDQVGDDFAFFGVGESGAEHGDGPDEFRAPVEEGVGGWVQDRPLRVEVFEVGDSVGVGDDGFDFEGQIFVVGLSGWFFRRIRGTVGLIRLMGREFWVAWRWGLGGSLCGWGAIGRRLRNHLWICWQARSWRPLVICRGSLCQRRRLASCSSRGRSRIRRGLWASF